MNDLLDAVGWDGALKHVEEMRFIGLFIYFTIWWIQNLWSKLLSFNQHRAKMFWGKFCMLLGLFYILMEVYVILEKNSWLYILILSSYGCNISKTLKEQHKKTTHPLKRSKIKKTIRD